MSNTANNRPLSKEALAAIPVLRSLIISEKGTSTLKRILNDYAKEEGEPLPFRKFGFPSAVEYLKATDEFVLRTHMGETTIFVKPKADTAHIQKMVAAQKPAKVPVKRNPAYSWKNPQLRYCNQTGYMPKPLPMPKQYGVLQKNPNNPLKRFFPLNCTTHYPKISIGNENVPPRPSVPPKVVPSLATPTVPYPKVVSAVKQVTLTTSPVVTFCPYLRCSALPCFLLVHQQQVMWEVTTTVDVSPAMGVGCVGQLEVFALVEVIRMQKLSEQLTAFSP
ncbi:conserved hypothetical protein [Culex quinquefasciatus]|uniref:HTH OST-type domain-containing protein n=1 Tax=Culex quinquefasciatus TaxID=7176 RepID=B0X2S6_CULQU|nr:conserved hypothetical protein [Culex quinquefasciatus]|eukprot:XP_001863948.1 conserved hypothetical protein [Culex quinquefasciatus]